MLNFRTEEQYGDYPTLEEIRRDYNELVEAVGSAITIAQLKGLDKKLTIEVNGMTLDEYENGVRKADGTRYPSRGTDEGINFIRYEAYGCLAYVYLYLNKGVVSEIIFDVWSNKLDGTFIENVVMEEAEAVYDAYKEAAENVSKITNDSYETPPVAGTQVVVVVQGGSVTEVYGTKRNVFVSVIDLDTQSQEEFQEKEAELAEVKKTHFKL